MTARRYVPSPSIIDGWSIYAAVMHPDAARRRREREMVRKTGMTDYGRGYYQELVRSRRTNPPYWFKSSK